MQSVRVAILVPCLWHKHSLRWESAGMDIALHPGWRKSSLAIAKLALAFVGAPYQPPNGSCNRLILNKLSRGEKCHLRVTVTPLKGKGDLFKIFRSSSRFGSFPTRLATAGTENERRHVCKRT